MKRIIASASIVLTTLVFIFADSVLIGSSRAQDAQSNQSLDIIVWTAVIPKGFPRNVYTWHLRSDGTYKEEGREALTAKPIQMPLSGRWTVEGGHMTLRQDGIRYVFEGEVVGNYYSGTLFYDGRPFSYFCAVKGKAAPQYCAAEFDVSTTPLPLGRVAESTTAHSVNGFLSDLER